MSFSEQCLIHFKPTSICLMFWARFWHVNKQLQGNVAGVVTEIQRIALERWKIELFILPEKVREDFTEEETVFKAAHEQ